VTDDLNDTSEEITWVKKPASCHRNTVSVCPISADEGFIVTPSGRKSDIVSPKIAQQARTKGSKKLSVTFVDENLPARPEIRLAGSNASCFFCKRIGDAPYPVIRHFGIENLRRKATSEQGYNSWHSAS
jgi:hypothetical protein